MMVEEYLEQVRKRVMECKRCDLYKTRNNPVFGEGSKTATIMFIGEAPGFNEDRQGRPFVGRAGKILDELLASVHLKREDIYIANILKCRPPDNRNPERHEIESCSEYLDAQIEAISPKVLVPLGNFAFQFLCQKYGLTSEKISAVHGKMFNITTLFGTIRIVPMFHPAVATYNLTKKTILLEDMKTLLRFL
jgi:uracil-DNA glycosylase